MFFIVNQVFRHAKTFLSLDGYSSWFLHKTNALGSFKSEESEEFKHFIYSTKYLLIMDFKHFSQSLFFGTSTLSDSVMPKFTYAIAFHCALILCTMDQQGLSLSSSSISAFIYHIHTFEEGRSFTTQSPNL